MTDRLRVLEELGMEFDRIGAAAAAPAGARRPLRVRRAAVLAFAALLVAAGLAVAASLIVTGEPIPSARQDDVPPEATPDPGTAQVADVRAEDPGGAPPWTVRLSRSRTGQLCAAVGQVVDERFGLVGLDGRFRPLPLLGVDACAAEGGEPPAVIGARMFAGRRREDVRTVVYGAAGGGLRGVSVRAAGGERSVDVGDEGTFAAAYRGYVEDVQPRVVLRFADGRERTFAFGVTSQPSAPDPEGGPPWVVDASARAGDRAGQTCAQFRRARDRFGRAHSSLSYPICGDLARDHVFFELAPFPRRQDHEDLAQTFPWDYGPARTVLWGAADPSVEAVVVRGAGKDVPVDLAGDGAGFVSVFPAGTEPESLEVVVRYRDGTERTYRGGQNLRDAGGRPRASEFAREVLGPVPGGPPPAPADDANAPPPMPDPFRHDAGSVKVGSRAGGFAVRSWRARVARTGLPMRCAQLGRIRDGRFVLPEGGSALGERGATCAPATARDVPYRTETFLDDPLAYAPRPTRTVVWGTAGAAARRVTIAGPWGRREVRAGPGGTFLLVLPPQRLDRRGVHVLTTYRDGSRASSRNPGFRPSRVVPGSVRIDARAPDPDGLQPWGLQVWRTRAGAVCRQEGRIVGGRVGSIDHDRGTFHAYPMYEGGACSTVPRTALQSSRPVGLSVSSQPGLEDEGDALRAARERRRTLPGRTTIVATARPDVELVTLRTPRDVRTLRPSERGGSMLVVYDGELLGGADIEYTAVLRGGRRVTHALPLSP